MSDTDVEDEHDGEFDSYFKFSLLDIPVVQGHNNAEASSSQSATAAYLPSEDPRLIHINERDYDDLPLRLRMESEDPVGLARGDYDSTPSPPPEPIPERPRHFRLTQTTQVEFHWIDAEEDRCYQCDCVCHVGPPHCVERNFRHNGPLFNGRDGGYRNGSGRLRRPWFRVGCQEWAECYCIDEEGTRFYFCRRCAPTGPHTRYNWHHGGTRPLRFCKCFCRGCEDYHAMPKNRNGGARPRADWW